MFIAPSSYAVSVFDDSGFSNTLPSNIVVCHRGSSGANYMLCSARSALFLAASAQT